MVDEPRVSSAEIPRWTVAQERNALPFAFLLLGAIAFAMIVWINGLAERQQVNFGLVHTLKDIHIHAIAFHGWLEESLYRAPDEQDEPLWSDLDLATAEAKLVMKGGTFEQVFVLKPPENPEMLSKVRQISALLIKLKELGHVRYGHADTAGMGSSLDHEFDAVLRDLLQKIDVLEEYAERDMFASAQGRGRLFYGILVAWGLLLAVAGTGLWTRERRRQAAESALKASNDQLELQAEELNKHRLNLIGLVEERTSELTMANRELHGEICMRRNAVEALQESKDRFEKLSMEFHALLDAIPDALALVSPELTVRWANRGAASMFGVPLTELTGKACCDLWRVPGAHPDHYPTVKAFQSGRAESAQMSAPDGSIRDTRVFPIGKGGGTIQGVLEIATDVTDRIALQAEAQRVAHLASLGELAAGVAHEINNPANGVINYAQMLIDELAKTGQQSPLPERIIKEADRIATIVRSLLSFAHESKAEKKPFHVHEILSDTLALSGTLLEKDGITIELDIADDLPRIIANHHQIEQVFLNIINNARYALNEKYAGYDKRKTLRISIHERLAGGITNIEIVFEDHGTGIPSEIIGRVRDPFFSTKPKGQGTGLGLSISHGIIGDHEGKLLLQSVYGEYTKVRLILPAEGKDESDCSGHR